jgi:2-polyprenyl-3-methyl-5-hydroxy-6-metoxy-1,4-benzoquinol methylase
MDRVAEDAVDAAMAGLANFYLQISGEMEAKGHATYIHRHRHEYVRTVRDVLQHRPLNGGKVDVLEIGAFFGVVCMALASLGYSVTASDLPEYIDHPEQQQRYSRFGIATQGVRLENFVLPFADESFDVIIMCEVLEHLNFNPLPLLKDINRVGRIGSLFYLSMPNAASIYHRRRLAQGFANGVQVDEFFEQLSPGSSLVANGHWREYTAAETRQMLEPLGFGIEKQYFFSYGEVTEAGSLRRKLARSFYKAFPGLKENQTTLAVKNKRTDVRFSIPSTVHPTLREL